MRLMEKRQSSGWRRMAPIARAGSRFTVILPAKVKQSLLRIFFAIPIFTAYCWRRTVGWRQQLSRGSFDPRQEPQETLKAEQKDFLRSEKISYLTC